MREFANGMNAQFICKLPSLVGEALMHSSVMFSPDNYGRIRDEVLDKITEKRETLLADGMRCIAWHYGVVIDDCGEVRECYTAPCTKETRVGNIKEHSLEELLSRRNQIFDVSINDICPVKKRIIKKFIREKGRSFHKLKETGVLEFCPISKTQGEKKNKLTS